MILGGRPFYVIFPLFLRAVSLSHPQDTCINARAGCSINSSPSPVGKGRYGASRDLRRKARQGRVDLLYEKVAAR